MTNPDDFEFYLWSLILIYTTYLLKQTFLGAYCHDNSRLDGQVIIVTGANSGIGFETALDLVKRGSYVILACRDNKRGLVAEQQIKTLSKSDNVRFMRLDLASFKSIRNFVNNVKKQEHCIHALVNNAGVFWCPFTRTDDGFELTFGVNYLGHFLLTVLLLPLLNACEDGARVVTVASIMHIFGGIKFDDLNYDLRQYDTVEAYSDSKLANVMFSNQLSKRLKSNHVKSICADPGIVHTNIGKDSILMGGSFFKFLLYPIFWMFFKSAHSGAQSVIYCVCSKDVQHDNNWKLYAECEARLPWTSASNEFDASKLWKESIKLTGICNEELLLLKY